MGSRRKNPAEGRRGQEDQLAKVQARELNNVDLRLRTDKAEIKRFSSVLRRLGAGVELEVNEPALLFRNSASFAFLVGEVGRRLPDPGNLAESEKTSGCIPIQIPYEVEEGQQCLTFKVPSFLRRPVDFLLKLLAVFSDGHGV
jgi:hypothetical protein